MAELSSHQGAAITCQFGRQLPRSKETRAIGRQHHVPVKLDIEVNDKVGAPSARYVSHGVDEVLQLVDLLRACAPGG